MANHPMPWQGRRLIFMVDTGGQGEAKNSALLNSGRRGAPTSSSLCPPCLHGETPYAIAAESMEWTGAAGQPTAARIKRRSMSGGEPPACRSERHDHGLCRALQHARLPGRRAMRDRCRSAEMLENGGGGEMRRLAF